MARPRHRHVEPRPGGLRGGSARGSFLGFGFYPRSGFIHVDLGPKREWGERFPPRPPFAPETPPPASASLETDYEMRRAAAVATLGSAGAEVAQQMLAETAPRGSAAVPHLDTLRWVFIAAALAGIAVAVDWKAGQR